MQHFDAAIADAAKLTEKIDWQRILSIAATPMSPKDADNCYKLTKTDEVKDFRLKWETLLQLRDASIAYNGNFTLSRNAFLLKNEPFHACVKFASVVVLVQGLTKKVAVGPNSNPDEFWDANLAFVTDSPFLYVPDWLEKRVAHRTAKRSLANREVTPVAIVDGEFESSVKAYYYELASARAV